MKCSRLLGVAALLLESVSAVELDIEDEQSIRDTAATLAYGMISRYTGNLTGDVPGNLPDPYHCESHARMPNVGHWVPY